MKNLSKKYIGIILTLVGFSIFAFADVCLKMTSEGYNPFAVALYMNIFTTVFMIPFIIYYGGLKETISTKSLKFHALRSYFMLINFLCIIYAFSQLPLATAYVIIFSFPFILNLQALIVLREKVSFHRWIAIVIGLIGIIVAMRPGLEPLTLAVGIAALGTFFNAAAAITTKFIDSSDHWLSYAFYMMLFQSPILAAIVLYQGGALLPNLSDWVLMPWFIAGGIAYVAALSLLPQALQRIDASIVGAFIYIAFPWGIFYGYFIFDDIPDLWTLLGAVIIIASGLFLIYREHKEHSKLLEIEEHETTHQR